MTPDGYLQPDGYSSQYDQYGRVQQLNAYEGARNYGHQQAQSIPYGLYPQYQQAGHAQPNRLYQQYLAMAQERLEEYQYARLEAA